MRIFPAKSNIRRTEQELRLQPFTLFAAAAVALAVSAAITYSFVYCDIPQQIGVRLLITGSLCTPVIVIFAAGTQDRMASHFWQLSRVCWRIIVVRHVWSGATPQPTADISLLHHGIANGSYSLAPFHDKSCG
jgi:hypothetical protein